MGEGIRFTGSMLLAYIACLERFDLLDPTTESSQDPG